MKFTCRQLFGALLIMLVMLTESIFLMDCTGAQRDDFFIRDGDVYVAWGNSITDDGIYPRLIENFVLSYYPEWKAEFYNLGWGGDRALNPGRIRRDMRLAKPSKVTIMLGMNDGGYKAYEENTLGTYIKGQLDLLDFLDSYTRPEVMLISTSPFDLYLRPMFYFGKDELRDMSVYPKTLARLSSGLRELAMIRGLSYVDLHGWLTPLFERIPEVDRNFLLTPDAIHPNIEGQLLMAYRILKEMGAPDEVMQTTLDAQTGRAGESRGCSVEEISGGPGGISFIRRDGRLPLPIPPSTDPLVFRLFPVSEKFNRDILCVTGLESGNYILRIGDVDVDKFTSEDLHHGVNLSEYRHTPQMLQAYQLYEATDKRNRAFWTRWREIYLGNVRAVTDSSPMNLIESDESAKMRVIEDEACREQEEIRRPKSHQFRITKDRSNGVIRQPRVVPAKEFLDGQVSLAITFDTSVLKSFRGAMYVFSNYDYAPLFHWGIYQTKGYYAPPFRMYDDGTHGDKTAGDGIYSVEIIVRKDSPDLVFYIQDEYFQANYWRQRNETYRNGYLDEIMKRWSSVSESASGNRIVLHTGGDVEVSCNASVLEGTGTR